MGFVDARSDADSNWTRYINCAYTEQQASIFQWQEFNKSFYGTKRRIKKGEELAAWYGPAFARILGLSTPPPTNEDPDSV